jgi:sec-independent protein translocase protein TatC
VAITTPRRRPKDPEGRMSLREHLRELRRRIFISASAIAVAAIIGWFLYDPLLSVLQEPLQRASARGHLAKLNFAQIGAAFNLKIRISVYLGAVLSCPIWLYQIWAFIVPGLTRREKRYAMGFLGASIPLFLAGLGLAWFVLPNAVRFLTDFTPKDSVNYITADEYLTFVTKIMIAFGVAFLVPVFLVALNLVGVLPARTMLRGWRLAVFLNFLFAAIASPTPDAGTMIALAMPMVGLYFGAVGLAWLVDRRRSRANPFAGLADDEASPLDEAPLPVAQLAGDDPDDLAAPAEHRDGDEGGAAGPTGTPG